MISNDKAAWLKGLLLTGLAGAGGGMVGFILSSLLIPRVFDTTASAPQGDFQRIMGDALLFMFCGASMALAILATDNVVSLRGRWSRDLKTGLWFFTVGSFGAGLVASIFYGIYQFTRTVPWAMAGAAIGACIGLLRKDKVQAARAAMGGALGGCISGRVVDDVLSFSYTQEAFAMGTFVGVLVTGALIGVFMQLVQGALKTAWLTGVTTGAYEGKQYLLNTSRVTVGASETHDISLYRNSELRVPSGALVNSNGTWRWQGEPAEINGVPQTDAPLASGDGIKLGNTVFRFRTKTGAEESAGSASIIGPPPSPPAAPPLWPAIPPVPGAHPVPSGLPVPSASPVPPPRPAAPQSGWLLFGPMGAVPLPASPATATVGRADDNDIVLTDPGVSSHHAVIEIQHYALKITDLDSTNGVTINRVKMPAGAPVILHTGDLVLLGEQEFQVRRT